MTEEYADDGAGGLRMVKRKVVIKNVPPDVSAVKLLVEMNEEKDYLNLTDEELEQEKLRLIGELVNNKSNLNKGKFYESKD